MAIAELYKKKILSLQKKFLSLQKGKVSLLTIIDEAEIPEAVYNSNAIENSTLTLKDTEKILLELKVPRNISIRELYEAKNLAYVIGYIRAKASSQELNNDLILLLHKMLMININESIAGRFREVGEYVRVGTYIAPAPEQIEKLLDTAINDYVLDVNGFITDKIAKIHLEFEHIHPFNDGNGRIGRVINNFLLLRAGFPPITIFNKDKHKFYYPGFQKYDSTKDVSIMEKTIAVQVQESLHKRIAYLQGEEIISVAEYAKKNSLNFASMLNASRRQTIPAFREKGKWKISSNFRPGQ
jgi:Fic family protein